MKITFTNYLPLKIKSVKKYTWSFVFVPTIIITKSITALSISLAWAFFELEIRIKRNIYKDKTKWHGKNNCQNNIGDNS